MTSQKLQDDIKKHRTFDHNPCREIFFTDSTVPGTCLHKETEEKYLFSSSYHVCKDCGEEVKVK